jgi:hypothetical protein
MTHLFPINMKNEPSATEGKWFKQERQKVAEYLEAEGCQHAGVAEDPAFFVEPYVTLWAVLSPKHKNRVAWWAISGDVPTDYMSSEEAEGARDALLYFSEQWREVAGYMRRGEEHPEMDLGDPKHWPELAAALEERAGILEEYANDEDAWEDE